MVPQPLKVITVDTEQLSTPFRLARRPLTFAEAIILSNEVAALLGSDLATTLQNPKTAVYALGEKFSGVEWSSWIDFVFQARRPGVVVGSSGAPVLYYAAATTPSGEPVWAPVTENLYDTVFPDAFDALVVVIRVVVGALGPFDKYARFLGVSKEPPAPPPTT